VREEHITKQIHQTKKNTSHSHAAKTYTSETTKTYTTPTTENAPKQNMLKVTRKTRSPRY